MHKKGILPKVLTKSGAKKKIFVCEISAERQGRNTVQGKGKERESHSYPQQIPVFGVYKS